MVFGFLHVLVDGIKSTLASFELFWKDRHTTRSKRKGLPPWSSSMTNVLIPASLLSSHNANIRLVDSSDWNFIIVNYTLIRFYCQPKTSLSFTSMVFSSIPTLSPFSSSLISAGSTSPFMSTVGSMAYGRGCRCPPGAPSRADIPVSWRTETTRPFKRARVGLRETFSAEHEDLDGGKFGSGEEEDEAINRSGMRLFHFQAS